MRSDGKLTVGARLLEERTRLGLSQQEMAQIGGVSRMTQLHYEKDNRSPDSAYLSALSATGLDVAFVVTGVRAGRGSIAPDESRLLDAYRATSGEQRAAALLVAESLAVATAVPLGTAERPPAYGARAARSGQSDAELWRAIARSLPTTPGVDPAARLTVQEWLAIVDGAFQRERLTSTQDDKAPSAKQG